MLMMPCSSVLQTRGPHSRHERDISVYSTSVVFWVLLLGTGNAIGVGEYLFVLGVWFCVVEVLLASGTP